MKDPRIKNSEQTIAKALEGDYRQEHLFSLKQGFELYHTYKEQIDACDQQIESYLEGLDSKISDIDSNNNPKRSKKQSSKNAPSFDLGEHLYRISGVDFTQIDGLNVLTVNSIITEVGLDPEAFETAKRFSSWLGLCPENRITGGQVKSSKTRKVVNRASKAFRMAANSLKNNKSSLGAFFRRMRARIGTPEAITATAHKLARIFFHLWKNGGTYKDLGAHYYEQKYKDRVLKNIKNKAKMLGYEISMQPIAQPEVS